MISRLSFLRDAFDGRGRAVPILGLVQMLGWGTTFYAPALAAPKLAEEFGWSLTFAVSGVTIGLIVAGLGSPIATRLVHRFGGHLSIAAGALITGAALLAMTLVNSRVAFVGVWICLGVGMSLVLSEPSYVALSQIFRSRARAPMVLISMMAGLAGPLSWFFTYLLMQSGSWRTPFLVYGAVFILVGAPLVAFVLPRPDKTPAETSQTSSSDNAPVWPPRGPPLWLQVVGFSAYAFTISATLAHFIPMMQRAGITPGTAVAIAMLTGPVQLSVRLFELIVGRKSHPLYITRIAIVTFVVAFLVALVAGFSIPAAIAFVVLMGFANGVLTIARGVLALAMFGHEGYPRAAGVLGFVALGSQALGPLAIALIIERGSDAAALATLAAFVTVSSVCFALLRRPS
jgi:MFS family permease